MRMICAIMRRNSRAGRHRFANLGGFTARMRLPYHPIIAFGLFHVIGLLSPIAGMATLSLIENPAATWLFFSFYINALPLVTVWFAANRAALADGRPLFRYDGYAPKVVRAQFRKNIFAFAAAFRLAAALADLTSVAMSSAAGIVDGFHYPFTRLLLIAAIYAVIAWFCIKAASPVQSSWLPIWQKFLKTAQNPFQSRPRTVSSTVKRLRLGNRGGRSNVRFVRNGHIAASKKVKFSRNYEHTAATSRNIAALLTHVFHSTREIRHDSHARRSGAIKGSKFGADIRQGHLTRNYWAKVHLPARNKV